MARISPFGTTATGRTVEKVTLTGQGLTVGLLTWGAVLQSLRLEGVGHDLTLGSDRLADYEGDMRYHGSLIAPVANRIGQARAMIGGREHHFDPTQPPHCLHSGSAGTHLKVWSLTEASETAATFALDLPDGEGGFPGNRKVTARFALTAPATLRLDITVTTDAPTLWNATNHSYWNLDGRTSWAGHALQIAAEEWLPTDSDDRPTGEIRRCEGSAMDFRQPRRITPGTPPLDNCFSLSRTAEPLRPVLTLSGETGVAMTVSSTEPGVQVYDARSARRPGGPLYEGIAVETQRWPDAPSFPAFPQIGLEPGAPLTQSTEWRFSRP